MKVTLGDAVNSSEPDAPVPETDTVKSWLALPPLVLPGSRAPVLLDKVMGTTITSPATSGRERDTVNSAVSVVSSSVRVVSPLVSSTMVASSSWINTESAPSLEDTV